MTEIHLSVPELEVEKRISIYAPQVELENYPDIIDYQLVVQMTKELRELIPKEFPQWERR